MNVLLAMRYVYYKHAAGSYSIWTCTLLVSMCFLEQVGQKVEMINIRLIFKFSQILSTNYHLVVVCFAGFLSMIAWLLDFIFKLFDEPVVGTLHRLII
jgi:hypothetical protein